MHNISLIKPDPSKGIFYEFTPERWAMLDTIAWSEGTDKQIEIVANLGYTLYSQRNYKTQERIQDTETGYDVTFGFREVADLSKHPRIHVPFGNTTSTAFGRYQVMDFTDKWIRDWLKAKGLPLFPSYQPEYQDQMCLLLIDAKREALKFVDAGLNGFNQALDKLSYEWASFYPGRYGQGFHSLQSLKDIYTKSLKKWQSVKV